MSGIYLNGVNDFLTEGEKLKRERPISRSYERRVSRQKIIPPLVLDEKTLSSVWEKQTLCLQYGWRMLYCCGMFVGLRCTCVTLGMMRRGLLAVYF